MSKMFYDSDEENFENEDENLEEENDEFYNMKIREKIEVKKKVFDVSDFDRKVAETIVQIHNKVKNDNKFNKWVEKNLSHLQNLYAMSTLQCSPVEFFTLIYDSSK